MKKQLRTKLACTAFLVIISGLIVKGQEAPNAGFLFNEAIEKASMLSESLPYSEDFADVSDFSLPAGWSSPYDWHVFNLWAMPNLNWPGGKVLLLWEYQMSGHFELRVESPVFDGTAASGVNMSFEHLVIDNVGNYTLKVQTSIDGDNWTDQWELYVASGNIPLTEVNLELEGVAGEMFQLAFTVEHPEGVSNDLDTWAIAELHLEAAYEGESYTLSFEVEDADGNSIDHAVIALEDTTNEQGDYIFENLAPGEYGYVVTAVGYEDAEGTISIVDEDVTEIVTLNLFSGYVVSFEVIDQENGVIDNATITFGGTTNAEGDYLFDEILPGTYDYTVIAEGYYPEEGSVEVVDQDVVVTVEMEKIGMYVISFNVVDENHSAIEHASISIREQLNAQGDYVFEDVQEGPLTWVVFADGYQMASEKIMLDNDMDITVVLNQEVHVNTFPWLEDFDDTDTVFPPEGWTQVELGEPNSASWVSSIGGIGTGRMLEHTRSPLGHASNWMITPKISIHTDAEALNYEFSFWERTLFMNAYEYGGVLISTGSPNPVAGDYVEVHESFEFQTDFTQIVIDLAPFAGEEIHIAFLFQGRTAHIWRIDDVMVTGDEPPTYTVSFHVEDTSGNPIENAIITLNENANEPGNYVFYDLEAGEYNYSVEADGFEPVDGVVTVVDDDVIETVIMEPVIINYTVTFIVEDMDGNTINLAVITLGDVQNEAGNYVFEEILPGEYEYLVQKEGFFDKTGALTLTDEDITHTVTLVEDDTYLHEISAGQPIIYPNPANSTVTVSFTGNSIMMLELVDMHGQVVYHDELKDFNKHVTIHVGTFTPGVYLLRIITDEAIYINRLHVIK